MVQDFSHQLQETMINHDPNGNGAYQETTRESIPRAPRQQKWWSTQTFWAILERVFYDQRHLTFCWEEFRKCAYYTNPRKTTMGITKNDVFQEGSDMFIRIYIYI